MQKQLFRFAGLLFFLSSAVTWSSEGHWPQWRGPHRDDLSSDTGLLKQWPPNGPPRVWLYKNAGLGYSGPAISQGKLFTMGARRSKEYLLAVDLTDAKELWAAEISRVYENGWGGGPRATPTLDDNRVYAMSGEGTLICAQMQDGKILWTRTMAELGGRLPNWGYTESVLVDNDRVICTPGGARGALVALDKMTGKTLWQSREFTDPAHYASVIGAEPGGRRQYIQLTEKNVAGISAHDGKLLWKSPFPGSTAVIPTPIYRDGYVYVTAAYNAGCKLVDIREGNKAVEVYANKVMQNHHGGVVLVGDYLYGFSERGGWLCQKFKTGEEVWSERQKLGKGPASFAEGMLYCLEENSGTVALIQASPDGWKEHGRFKLDPQSTQRSSSGRIWTHPVITGGRLYLRDQELVYCYDVKSKSGARPTGASASSQ